MKRRHSSINNAASNTKRARSRSNQQSDSSNNESAQDSDVELSEESESNGEHEFVADSDCDDCSSPGEKLVELSSDLSVETPIHPFFSSWVSDTLRVCQSQTLCNWVTINLPRFTADSCDGFSLHGIEKSTAVKNTGRLKHLKCVSRLAINCPSADSKRSVINSPSGVVTKPDMLSTIVSETVDLLLSNRLIELFIHQRYSSTSAPYLINIILSQALYVFKLIFPPELQCPPNH